MTERTNIGSLSLQLATVAGIVTGAPHVALAERAAAPTAGHGAMGFHPAKPLVGGAPRAPRMIHGHMQGLRGAPRQGQIPTGYPSTFNQRGEGGHPPMAFQHPNGTIHPFPFDGGAKHEARMGWTKKFDADHNTIRIYGESGVFVKVVVNTGLVTSNVATAAAAASVLQINGIGSGLSWSFKYENNEEYTYGPGGVYVPPPANCNDWYGQALALSNASPIIYGVSGARIMAKQSDVLPTTFHFSFADQRESSGNNVGNASCFEQNGEEYLIGRGLGQALGGNARISTRTGQVDYPNGQNPASVKEGQYLSGLWENLREIKARILGHAVGRPATVFTPSASRNDFN